jgi:TonB family protein
VLLAVVVDTNGRPNDLRVIRPLGLGLDEMAMEAVRQWLFRPGTKDGKPVAVQATIQINFRLP